MEHFDELFKYLGDYSPDAFAALSLAAERVRVVALLNTEHLTVKMHHSDMTFRISLPDRGEEAILHLEFQTEDSRDKPMPFRMLSYASFLVHQHEMNVYSTVFYLRPPAGRNDPGGYSYGDDTIGGLRFKYKVIRVYELDGAAHLNPDAGGLLPLTPLMKPPSGMSSEAWVEKCIDTTLAAPVDSQDRATLLHALSVFGGLIHPRELFQDSALEAIMQESPVYQSIIQRGKVEGKAEGINLGRAEGITLGARQTRIESALDILADRFPTADINALKPQLEAITDLNRLKQLPLNASKAKSLHDFQQSLNGA